MASSDYRRRILNALDGLGAVQVRIDGGTKHAKLSWMIGGRGYYYRLSRSCSDRRAVKGAICDIRRMIRNSSRNSNKE